MSFSKSIIVIGAISLFLNISYSQEKKVVLNFKSIHMEWEGKLKDDPDWLNRNSSLTLDGGNVTFEMDGIPSLYRRTNTPSKRLKTPDGITYVQSEYLNEINKTCFIEMLLTDRMQVRIIEDDGSIFQMSKDLVNISNETSDVNSVKKIDSDCKESENEFIACALYNQELLKEINTLKKQNQELISQYKEMTILTTKGAENIERALEDLKKKDRKILELQNKITEKEAIISKLTN